MAKLDTYVNPVSTSNILLTNFLMRKAVELPNTAFARSDTLMEDIVDKAWQYGMSNKDGVPPIMRMTTTAGETIVMVVIGYDHASIASYCFACSQEGRLSYHWRDVHGKFEIDKSTGARHVNKQDLKSAIFAIAKVNPILAEIMAGYVDMTIPEEPHRWFGLARNQEKGTDEYIRAACLEYIVDRVRSSNHAPAAVLSIITSELVCRMFYKERYAAFMGHVTQSVDNKTHVITVRVHYPVGVLRFVVSKENHVVLYTDDMSSDVKHFVARILFPAQAASGKTFVLPSAFDIKQAAAIALILNHCWGVGIQLVERTTVVA